MQLRSDVSVELIDSMGSDLSVARAAWVSTKGARAADEVDSDRIAGLINFLMRNRHGSVFEHNSMTFLVEAPIFTWREHHRHRIGISYNEVSGRYSQLEPVFYVPGPDRAIVQHGKPGAYVFVPGSTEQQDRVVAALCESYGFAYAKYVELLELGIAREVARMGLPVGIFSACYVTMNARSLMNFLSLRTRREGSAFPSFPQREIELVAERYELEFARLFPITYEAFNANGRVAP